MKGLKTAASADLQKGHQRRVDRRSSAGCHQIYRPNIGLVYASPQLVVVLSWSLFSRGLRERVCRLVQTGAQRVVLDGPTNNVLCRRIPTRVNRKESTLMLSSTKPFLSSTFTGEGEGAAHHRRRPVGGPASLLSSCSAVVVVVIAGVT